MPPPAASAADLMPPSLLAIWPMVPATPLSGSALEASATESKTPLPLRMPSKASSAALLRSPSLVAAPAMPEVTLKPA